MFLGRQPSNQCVMGLINMGTEGKHFSFKQICVFLIIMSFVILAGCSLQYTNVFAVKSPSSNDLEKPVKNKDGEQQVVYKPNTEDSVDKNINLESDILENDEDKPRVDKSGINGSNTFDNHADYQDNKAKGKDADMDKNMDNDTCIDNSSNSPIDKGLDKVNHGGIDNDNKPSDFDKTEAVPAAKIIRNSTNQELKQVAITFDDGPDGHFTPQILDILGKYDVKATFFILGSAADENRDVLKRIDEEGHVVASHGWGHKNFTKISKSNALDELKKTNDLIKEVTGKSNALFRLPYGAFNNTVLKTVADQGFHNIYWSIDPRDWSGDPPEKILNNIKQNIEPGAIILLHSSGSKKSIPNTVKTLPNIIEFLQEQGYDIVTIPELLEEYLYQ